MNNPKITSDEAIKLTSKIETENDNILNDIYSKIRKTSSGDNNNEDSIFLINYPIPRGKMSIFEGYIIAKLKSNGFKVSIIKYKKIAPIMDNIGKLVVYWGIDIQSNNPTALNEYKFLMMPKPDVIGVNNRIIPKDAMDAAIENFEDRMTGGMGFVTLGQCHSSDINPADVIGNVTDITYDSKNNTYISTVKLDDSDMSSNAKIARALIESGCKFVLGTNKTGSIEYINDSGVNVCDNDINILHTSLLNAGDVGLDVSDPDII